MVGGSEAWLIVDDTALPKKGERSVGVAPQYALALGKTANCQTLVSLTLASGEVPVMVGLRLFLPESWTSDPARLARAGVPGRSWRLSDQARDRARRDRSGAHGRPALRLLLADAGYGLSAQAEVYPVDVVMIFPIAGRGHPRKNHVPDAKSVSAEKTLAAASWRTLSWRRGIKRPLAVIGPMPGIVSRRRLTSLERY